MVTTTGETSTFHNGETKLQARGARQELLQEALLVSNKMILVLTFMKQHEVMVKRLAGTVRNEKTVSNDQNFQGIGKPLLRKRKELKYNAQQF